MVWCVLLSLVFYVPSFGLSPFGAYWVACSAVPLLCLVCVLGSSALLLVCAVLVGRPLGLARFYWSALFNDPVFLLVWVTLISFVQLPPSRAV